MTGQVRRRATTGAWAVATVFLLLAAAVLVAALTGPVPAAGTPPPPAPTPTPTATGTPRDAPSAPPTPSPTAPPVKASPSSAWTWVFLVGLAMFVAFVGLLVLGLRRLLREEGAADRRSAPSRPDLPSGSPSGPVSGPPPDRVVDAADAGLALLSGPGQVGDAVVACWLRLEQAAAATGLPRHPASTPSEFTAELLVAGLGQDAPVRELLGLYHRARFGSRPLPPEAAERAVACLTAIRASAQDRTVAS